MATANSILTPTAVTREALRVLHEELSFIGTINRVYDDSFAKEGAKIGDQLTIRLPNQYNVTDGPVLTKQDTNEKSVVLTMATQKHVGVNFTTADLTKSIDDFSNRILRPAMSVLASVVENDALSMGLDVSSLVGTGGTTPASLAPYLQAKAKLQQHLAPRGDRCLQIDSNAEASTVDALKGLFQSSDNISKQYREGLMGRTAGFDWYTNERVPVLTTGTANAATALINGVPLTESTSVATDGWGAVEVITKGTVVTFAGVFDIHQETKAQYNFLKQFVVTADTTAVAGAMTIPISPAIISVGAYQNVSALPADNAAITIDASMAISTPYAQNLAYQKDAFAFVTADLLLPKGVDFAARETFDGLSLRVVRQYDINNDEMPCRIDILYGFKTLREELACRITG